MKQTKGIFFILAGVPIHDTGGGSRGAQVAFELLRQNFFVVYIHKYGSNEGVNLGLSFHHPSLLNYSLDQFPWNQFEKEYRELLNIQPVGVLIEFALIDFLPLISNLKSFNAKVCYDLLDKWDSQLGAAWYKESIENQVVFASDVLIATATNLVEDLEARSNRPVQLVPNAVNLRLFNNHHRYTKPEDLPGSELVITYIGALWGEWFDWDLLIDVARSYPEAAIMVIGDYRGQCPEPMPNLFFLGLKPQASLPAYLAYSRVTIIPWKENEITYSTSPLKLYEYLAMRTPVVVPDLPLLRHIPNVYPSKGKDEFIKNIMIAAKTPTFDRDFDEYVANNSWEERVKQLTRLMGFNA